MLDGVVLPLPINASSVLTFALLFHLLIVDRVADGFLVCTFVALTSCRGLLGMRVRMLGGV